MVTDAPDVVLELLTDDLDGWFDVEDPPGPQLPPLDLPTAPKRVKRPD